MADAVTNVIADVGGIVSTIFWIALGVAVVVRVIIAIRRRKADGVRSGVLKPFASSAAVQSELYGWKPSDSEQIVEQQNRSGSIYPTEVDDGEGRRESDGNDGEPGR